MIVESLGLNGERQKTFSVSLQYCESKLFIFLFIFLAGNHMGTERTLSALSSKYYWVGMAATVKKVLKSCVVCLASRPAMSILSSEFEDGTPFSQTWDSDASLLLPKNAGAEQKKADAFDAKEFDNSKCNVFPEGENQFLVTDELTGPEVIDSDLDLDQDSAAPDKLFDTRVDIHRARRFWHKVHFLSFLQI